MLENNFEKLKTNLKLTKLKWEEEMNRNLLCIELIKLIQGMEMEYKVIRELKDLKVLNDARIERCLIQCDGMPIYRIEHGIKTIQVDGKDWILCW